MNQSIQRIFSMLTVLVTIILTACSQNTVYVAPPTGGQESDNANVQAAFDEVIPGGTVQFASGMYYLGEGVELKVPNVTVLGHKDGTIIRGCDPEAFDVEDSEVETLVFGCTGFYVQGKNQTIKGFTFEYTWHGIVIGPFPKSAEEHPNFWNSDEDSSNYESSGHLIEGNTFRATPNGLRVLGTGDEISVVRDNDFIDVFHAIGIYGAPLHFLDNRITVSDPEGVPFSDQPGSAVIIAAGQTNCSGHIVGGNRIEGYPDPIYVSVYPGEVCHGAEISNNTILASRVKIPKAWAGATPTPSDSTMVGTPITLMNKLEAPAGAPQTESKGVLENILIKGNQILGAEGLGILIQNASNNTIIENRIADISVRKPFPGITWDGNEQEWEDANGSGIWISAGSNGNEMSGNTFQNIASYAVYVEGDSNRVSVISAGDLFHDLGNANQVTTSSQNYFEDHE